MAEILLWFFVVVVGGYGFNMKILSYFLNVTPILAFIFMDVVVCQKPVPNKFIVWGPGLTQGAVIPIRYLFIQPVDENGNNFTKSLERNFSVSFSQPQDNFSRVYPQVIDVHDGSYVVMFRMHKSYKDLTIDITYDGERVGDSPYTINGWVYHENCYCPVEMEKWLKAMNCQEDYEEMNKELETFPTINATTTLDVIVNTFKNPGAFSIVHYVIKDNKIYRKTFGQHVQFKTFSDSILLSLTRKMFLPDMEFFMNLGDFTLIYKRSWKPVALFAWGGQKDSLELVLPSYEITNNVINSLYSTFLDTIKMHGSGPKWSGKIEKAIFRGRDSSLSRMKLYFLSKENPGLIDANITRMFFFHWKNVTTTMDIPFYDFYNYKYIINMDGTVAPYRTPYLLGSKSLMLKEESGSYEFFYKLMKPGQHYISFKSDLSDLIQKIEWAKKNDKEAEKIAINAKKFAFEHLLPEHIYCYHAVYFQKYAKRLVSPIKIFEDMEYVEHGKDLLPCECHEKGKREDL